MTFHISRVDLLKIESEDQLLDIFEPMCNFKLFSCPFKGTWSDRESLTLKGRDGDILVNVIDK